ncbi:MAG: substrate-binding domain-containing protein [Treponema sp.]|uniref:substrate-binding domain-containing protein n=1 Tax=Treponema sp. TaxID=166 RepID=UPI0025E96459|nr:substrate-binding domain-containing protein [Treponema sp.]MBR0494549.1 substrate-binding domain-containing protein [Treponema sp.]
MLRKNKVLVFSVFFTVLISISLSSCKRREIPDSEKSSGEAHKVCIGFSIDTLALERWQRDLDIFMNRVKELGADVIVQNAGNSIEVQNKQLLYLMERKVDAIVVLPKKRDSLTEIVQKIRARGIPVISYDRLITDADISMYISVNTEKVGELMARRMMSFNVGPYWYCILGPEDDFNMILLQRGLKSAIQGKKVQILGTYYTEGWNYDLSYQEAVNIMTGTRLPDAIICGNDALAGSVIQAMSDYCPDRNIAVCGQDADIAACQNIVRGKQAFTLYKPITTLAEKTADISVRLARGESVSSVVPSGSTINNGFGDIPVVWLDPEIVTKDTIDSVIVGTGFHTHGEIYKEK